MVTAENTDLEYTKAVDPSVGEEWVLATAEKVFVGVEPAAADTHEIFAPETAWAARRNAVEDVDHPGHCSKKMLKRSEHSYWHSKSKRSKKTRRAPS